MHTFTNTKILFVITASNAKFVTACFLSNSLWSDAQCCAHNGIKYKHLFKVNNPKRQDQMPKILKAEILLKLYQTCSFQYLYITIQQEPCCRQHPILSSFRSSLWCKWPICDGLGAQKINSTQSDEITQKQRKAMKIFIIIKHFWFLKKQIKSHQKSICCPQSICCHICRFPPKLLS